MPGRHAAQMLQGRQCLFQLVIGQLQLSLRQADGHVGRRHAFVRRRIYRSRLSCALCSCAARRGEVVQQRVSDRSAKRTRRFSALRQLPSDISSSPRVIACCAMREPRRCFHRRTSWAGEGYARSAGCRNIGAMNSAASSKQQRQTHLHGVVAERQQHVAGIPAQHHAIPAPARTNSQILSSDLIWTRARLVRCRPSGPGGP